MEAQIRKWLDLDSCPISYMTMFGIGALSKPSKLFQDGTLHLYATKKLQSVNFSRKPSPWPDTSWFSEYPPLLVPWNASWAPFYVLLKATAILQDPCCYLILPDHKYSHNTHRAPRSIPQHSRFLLGTLAMAGGPWHQFGQNFETARTKYGRNSSTENFMYKKVISLSISAVSSMAFQLRLQRCFQYNFAQWYRRPCP